MRQRLWFGILGTLALAGMPAPAGAQPVGEEFQVNTYTTHWQAVRGERAVAADASGNFVVVWYSFNGQDGDRAGVFGQRYDSEGVAVGGEFQINSFTTDDQSAASVASDADGNFVVVWDGVGQGDRSGIFGQRFDSEGVAQGDEFRVNTYTTNPQENPAVASDASGNFVVVWECNAGYPQGPCGIFGQRYDSGGVAQGEEFRVDSSPAHLSPSVASDASGNFVVVYDGVFGRRYDNEGVPQGAEFRINSYTTNGQVDPSVASDSSGNFVVVWESQLQDGDSFGIFGQRYDSTGVQQGAEFRVNSYTTDTQNSPSVASDASGNFVVVWASQDQDGDTFGVFGQLYHSEGAARGAEFQINSYTTGEQRFPAVATTGISDFVVVWESYYQLGNSPDNHDVFGQRFDFGGAASITVVVPNTNVKWRIGSSQKIQWTHSLDLDATFRIELDRDDDGDYEELVADDVAVDSATRGSFGWTVTGPVSAAARLRVTWTDERGVSDASDVTFQIRPAPLSATDELQRR